MLTRVKEVFFVEDAMDSIYSGNLFQYQPIPLQNESHKYDYFVSNIKDIVTSGETEEMES